jgi:hypothetical protein
MKRRNASGGDGNSGPTTGTDSAPGAAKTVARVADHTVPATAPAAAAPIKSRRVTMLSLSAVPWDQFVMAIARIDGLTQNEVIKTPRYYH